MNPRPHNWTPYNRNVRPGPPPAELSPYFPAEYGGLLGLAWEDDGDTLAAGIGGIWLAILRPGPGWAWHGTIEIEVPATRWDPPDLRPYAEIGPYDYVEDCLIQLLLRAASLLAHEREAEAYLDRLLAEADDARDADEAAGVYDRLPDGAYIPTVIR